MKKDFTEVTDAEFQNIITTNVSAVFASDAAKYITGVVLPVDGGNSIGF